ncbi:MAG TPA: DNA repair protein RecO [Sphingobacteriaceae bacterium]
MLHKTRGIVFKTTDYSESSVVVQVFTEKFGLQSYLINGVKKPKARIRGNILQPLHLLEMVVYYKPSGSIQRVSEVRQVPLFQTIPYDVVKSSLVMFLNEVLYKAIRQEAEDEALFEFLFQSIELLDRTEKGLAVFHLYFLLQLTRYLGFYPDRTLENSADYFDLVEGNYSRNAPAHVSVLQPPHTAYWTSILNSSYDDLASLRIPADERKLLLTKVLDYYRLHIEGFGTVRSHQVLEEILS